MNNTNFDTVTSCSPSMRSGIS